MATPQQEFSEQLNSFTAVFYKVAKARMDYAAAAIAVRQNGEVPLASQRVSFEDARFKLLSAARVIDQQLDEVERKDPKTYVEIVGRMNEATAKIPGMNLSSPSMYELVDAAIPVLPAALYVPQESMASQAAVRAENERYSVSGTPLAGLAMRSGGLNGFWAAAVAPFSMSACLATVAGLTVATGGVGAVAIVGCALVAIAAVVAVGAVAYMLVRGVWAALNPAQAAADALGDAYAAVRKTCEDRNLDPAQCTQLLKAAAKLVKDPPRAKIPWGIVIPVAAGAALWFFWPTIMGLAKSARAKQTPAVAGLPRSRRITRRSR